MLQEEFVKYLQTELNRPLTDESHVFEEVKRIIIRAYRKNERSKNKRLMYDGRLR